MRGCTSNACAQGRAACPTPLACEVPESTDADRPPTALAILIWVAISFVLFVAAGVIATCLHRLIH